MGIMEWREKEEKIVGFVLGWEREVEGVLVDIEREGEKGIDLKV